MYTPMDILREFPVRKSKKQKERFRQAVQDYAQRLGYKVTVEKGGLGARNLILGDPEQADYLVTAHYDTCARLLVPNLITPCNFWGFLGYQLLVTLLLLLGPGLIALMIRPFSPFWAVEGFCLLCLAECALMFAGPANPSNANDNTSGVITVLEIARTLPEAQRGRVCFVLFDLEEWGLVGSASYRSAHRAAAERQLVLNLDCVGDGDHIRLFPTRKLKKDRKRLTDLYRACGYFGPKSVLVHEKGFSIYPSDQASFPYGVGICALRRSRAGLYLGRIHTPRDTVLEQTNINILRAALITFLTCGPQSRKGDSEHETV